MVPNSSQSQRHWGHLAEKKSRQHTICNATGSSNVQGLKHFHCQSLGGTKQRDFLYRIPVLNLCEGCPMSQMYYCICLLHDLNTFFYSQYVNVVSDSILASIIEWCVTTCIIFIYTVYHIFIILLSSIVIDCLACNLHSCHLTMLLSICKWRISRDHHCLEAQDLRICWKTLLICQIFAA